MNSRVLNHYEIYYHFHFMQVRQGAQLERYLIQQEQKPNFTIRREVPL